MTGNVAKKARGSRSIRQDRAATTDDSRIIVMKKAHNSRLTINRLPSELLSHIFLVAEELARGTRPRTVSYRSLQEIASHVCSYWRNVAINSPALWTYIHITRPKSHELAYLYLSRAGPSSLLDIEIEMRSRFWDKLKLNAHLKRNAHDRRWDQVTSIPAMLESFSFRARVNRWKSLSVCAKEPEMLLEFTRFLNAKSSPALQFLSLQWNARKHSRGWDREQDAVFHCVRRSSKVPKSHSLSGAAAPSLRHIELTSVPSAIFLDTLLLPFTGLKSLSVTAAFMAHETVGLYNLLSSCSQLESLHISTGFAHFAEAVPSERVCLPSLHSFSIIGCSPNWVLNILKMIDAPALHTLTINVCGKRNTHVKIAEYIATAGNESDDTLASIYPVLRKLDICNFSCPDKALARMLLALPSVTCLYLRGNQAEVLAKPPWPLPNLEFLALPEDYHLDLGKILRRRGKAGFRVTGVSLKTFWSYGAETELPRFVKVQVHPEPVVRRDYDETSSEEEEGGSDSDGGGSDSYGDDDGSDSDNDGSDDDDDGSDGDDNDSDDDDDYDRAEGVMRGFLDSEESNSDYS